MLKTKLGLRSKDRNVQKNNASSCNYRRRHDKPRSNLKPGVHPFILFQRRIVLDFKRVTMTFSYRQVVQTLSGIPTFLKN